MLFPFAIAAALSLHGLRKRSLSPSGAAAAFVVGFLMMSPPLRAFGVSLIVFYLVGSRATKYGKQRKAALEEGYHEAGYRSASQVLCNACGALAACVLWTALFVPASPAAALLRPLGVPAAAPYAPAAWCPLDARVAGGRSRALLFAALGHFACCLGDTLASELGVLARARPRLVTSGRAVPPGTNGGVSPAGTAASAAGGLLAGAALAASLAAESARCRRADTLALLLWGAAGGVGGSLIDSVLGATVQQTRYSEAAKRVAAGGETVVSGWNILSNNQVNLVSSLATAALGVVVSVL